MQDFSRRRVQLVSPWYGVFGVSHANCHAPGLLLLLMVTTVLVGCGDGRPSLVPVSGQVLIDGKPLKYGSIRFVPTDSRSSSGTLDEEGRFSLTCFEENDGVALGRHRISVSAGESLNEEQIRWHAPKKYAKHKTSELEEEITESTTSVTINLTWDGQKPYVEGQRPDPNRQSGDDDD